MTAPAVILQGSRGVGAVEALQEALPRAALEAFAILTWLGSVAVAIGLLALVYWFVARDRGAFGLAVVLGGMALTVALKAFFALPRPPVAGRLIEASGFGFPSGHAITATVVWGYLALAFERGSPRQRYAGAGLVVAVVAVSRVAVGVHYAVDVLAGVAVGGAYLLAAARLEDATRAFGVALLIAGAAVVATGAGGDALMLAGGAAAGWLLWPRMAVPDSPWRRDGLLPAAVGGAGIAAVVFAGRSRELAPPLAFVLGAVTIALLLWLPALVERVRGLY